MTNKDTIPNGSVRFLKPNETLPPEPLRISSLDFLTEAVRVGLVSRERAEEWITENLSAILGARS